MIRRRRVRAALAALIVGLGLAGSSMAVAAGTTPAPPNSASNPLAPGVPVSPAPSTSTATPTIVQTASSNSAGSSSLSSNSVLFIAIGAVVLLIAISYFIWRDARRRAPVKGRGLTGELGLEGRRAGSKPPRKPRKLSAAEKRRRKRGRARR
ncbi:MAG TPA: hypothetical protein VGL51_07620 [Solirubrobacteraceae bacterium]